MMVSMGWVSICRHVTVTIFFGRMLTSASFLVSTSLLVTQKGSNVAIVTSPPSGTHGNVGLLRRYVMSRRRFHVGEVMTTSVGWRCMSLEGSLMVVATMRIMAVTRRCRAVRRCLVRVTMEVVRLIFVRSKDRCGQLGRCVIRFPVVPTAVASTSDVDIDLVRVHQVFGVRCW